jgi:heme oxygenase
VSSPSWMLSRVARETLQYHAAADADRLALMNAESLRDYLAYLVCIYGLESPVELAVYRLFDRESSVGGLRMRMGRLHDDLLSLGMTSYEISTAARCTWNPVRTRAEAFGWLFAIERSALLSGLIRRYLASQLPAAALTGGRYLDAYASTAGDRLRILGDFMSEQAGRGAVQPEAIVDAATRAFNVQRQWYGRVVRRRTQPVAKLPANEPRMPVVEKSPSLKRSAS